MDDHKAIGARIRQGRLAKGLTQVELAVAIGVSRAHLTNAERGKVGLALDKLSIAASETGTTVAWLIGEAGPVDQGEVALLTAFKALDQRDRETLIRVAQSFRREDPPAAPTAPPRTKDPNKPPFRVRGGRKENPVSADCPPGPAASVVPLSARR